MIKSIFVEAGVTEGIEKSNANHLIVASYNRELTRESWEDLRNIDRRLGIAFQAFSGGICPANPQALSALLSNLDEYLKYGPNEIWLDHLRFDGYWEGIKDGKIPDLHIDCRYCTGLDRQEVITDIARQAKQRVGLVKLGYFGVPFKCEEVHDLTQSLGQDHSKLGKIFDFVSPMLYQRMIGKPASYISEYVKWLAGVSENSILPIVQIKDMPDNLVDKMSEEDIKAIVVEAVKPPSIGVCIFVWSHALEKKKTEIVSKILSSL